MEISSLVLVLVLVVVHVLASKLRFVHVVPRSRWLSLAGGVSVAYVFGHVLPELHRGQHSLQRELFPGVRFLEEHTYLIALLGLAIFYGLEMAVRHSRRQGKRESDLPGPGIFWIHIGSFSVYNALIGYLLLNDEKELLGRILFTVAIGLHFVVNDYGLNQHHRERYRRQGRWILSAAVLLGWFAAVYIQLSEQAMAVLFALIGGGIVMNVMKEELPETQESRFWPFAAGAFCYATLLVLVNAAGTSGNS